MGGQFPPDWGWSVCSGLQLKSYWFRGGQFHPDLGGQFDRILHITGPDSAERIMKEGINADEEGYIYLLTELEIPEDVYGKKFSIPDIVVTSQIGYMNYIIIEIDPKGITARLQKDNVAEITAYAQRRVKQKKIEPKFLKIGKIQQVDVKQVRLFNTLLIEKLMSITSK